MAQMPVPVPTSRIFFGFSIGGAYSLLSMSMRVYW